jgi:hypothetical protein
LKESCWYHAMWPFPSTPSIFNNTLKSGYIQCDWISCKCWSRDGTLCQSWHEAKRKPAKQMSWMTNIWVTYAHVGIKLFMKCMQKSVTRVTIGKWVRTKSVVHIFQLVSSKSLSFVLFSFVCLLSRVSILLPAKCWDNRYVPPDLVDIFTFKNYSLKRIISLRQYTWSIAMSPKHLNITSQLCLRFNTSMTGKMAMIPEKRFKGKKLCLYKTWMWHVSGIT